LPPSIRRKEPSKLWKAFVAAYFLAWLLFLGASGDWLPVIEHWRMALVMSAGSFVAGSTPLGGGTVAFPILVLVFHSPASNARNFAFAIQSIGMTSAFVFLLVRRVPLPLRFLTGAALGSAAGLIAGTFFVAPLFEAAFVKLTFACLWMSFALLHVARTPEICALKGSPPQDGRAMLAGAAAGLIGGVLAAMIGVGVEMAVYSTLVLIYRADLKIAIPTAVSAAALCSIEGAALHAIVGDFDRETILNWLAAGPVVILGAPIGAWLTTRIPRKPVIGFVCFLCLLQFAFTLRQSAAAAREWRFVAAAMLVTLGTLTVLYRFGKRRELNRLP
jgi:uncharacterized membrane protein YfcA